MSTDLVIAWGLIILAGHGVLFALAWIVAELVCGGGK